MECLEILECCARRRYRASDGSLTKPVEATVLRPAAVFNNLIADSGDLVIDMIASPSFDADDCGGDSFISVTVSYTLDGPNDGDGNGVPDDCECIADLDGSEGFAELMALLAARGACVDCPENIDGDDAVGFNDLLILLNGWGPSA